MRYSYEYKLECVELYRQGKYPETPPGVSQNRFRHNIRDWAKMEESYGPEVLKHKNFNKVWTPEEKYELVVKVIAGNSRTDVALKDGFSPRMLYQWVQKYKIQGYNGLIEQQKGHSCKNLKMKKKENPAPLTESEREELICLRAENEYIKAENEVIEKQQSLKNFAKKDIS